MSAPTLILSHDGRWKHLFLKYIRDVRLDVHCTRCLVGGYDRRISPNKPGKTGPITLDQDAPLGFYLCAVSRAGWHYNRHLAFVPGDGVISKVWDGANRLNVVVYGAREVPITDEFIAPDDPHINDPKFTTCRNWQHAHHLARSLT